MGGVGVGGATNDPDLPELKEARADQMVDMCGQRHRTVNKNAEVSDGLDRLDVSIGCPDFCQQDSGGDDDLIRARLALFSTG